MILYFHIWVKLKILSCKNVFLLLFSSTISSFTNRTDEQRSETFANYVKHFADLKCSLLPSSFTTVTPLSVHVRGFEPEQVYQQLKSINEARLKPFVATIAKNKTRQKSFGNLLRPPSPEPALVEENNGQEEDDDQKEELPAVAKKNPKKKKSVT